ncbi:response regulator, partial [Shewanella sp. Isolate7]|uniref:response regulator n=1 Tax=Shewanella sp. Isolate7 TaxID=2908528 RepID=UPI001EFC8C3C
EALRLFKEHKPDLITMDLTMPKIGSLKCIKHICELSKDTSILVILALSDCQTGLKALQFGARGLICKPFTDEQLIMALDKLIRK